MPKKSRVESETEVCSFEKSERIRERNDFTKSKKEMLKKTECQNQKEPEREWI